MALRNPLMLGALAGALSLAAGTAQAQNVQVGALECALSGSVGLIIASQKAMSCTFRNSRGNRELYSGVINRFGLDIGATTGGSMVWSVFAPSGQIQRFALAGSYGGASAEATVGAGLGANVLVGGMNRSVALQPVSVQGQTGLNLALGVAALELKPAAPRRR